MTARIYHLQFVDEGHDAFELTRDIRMGTDWCADHGIDPTDHLDLYTLVGTVDRETPTEAYRRWEAGWGHDPSETRSMAVGDLIVIDGTVFFVDSIGFEVLDMRDPYYDLPRGWYRDHLVNVGLPQADQRAQRLRAVIDA
jgi:hypothetical protein